MKVPLKALSWVVRFFWIFTIAFVITCAYSATCVKVDFSEPHSSFEANCVLVTWPMEIANEGYYDITDLTLNTQILGDGGVELASSQTTAGTISPQQQAEILHNISLCVNEMLVQEQYLFNDSDLTLYSSASLDYAGIIPFELGTNMTIPWGAPLFNLSVSNPQYSQFNTSHVQFMVPISFQNHCPYFDTSGTLRLEILNTLGQAGAVDRLPVHVQYMEDFNGSFSGFFQLSVASGVDSVRLFWETADFTYGPWVIEK